MPIPDARSQEDSPEGESAGGGFDSLVEGDEQEEAHERTAPPASVIHEAIYQEAQDELARSTGALFWSGLSAGLSLGFSFIAQGLLEAMLPEAPWRPLIASLGYTVGFLVVILGRQQLFTENTLTPIILLLRKPRWPVLLDVLRLWGTVLAANLLGALLLAWGLSLSDLFSEMWPPAVYEALLRTGEHYLALDFSSTFVGGIFAGWLLALMVWMLPYAASEKVSVVVIITYLIGLGGFAHCITGSIETMYAVLAGPATWGDYVRFFLPTLLGNVLGGVTLVAVLNHAQVASGRNS